MRRAVTLLLLGVLSWLTFPAHAGDGVPKPTIVIANEGKCIAPAEEMRRNHMEMLKHQRNETLREGKRGMPASLNACIECHAGKSTGSVLGRTISAKAATPTPPSSSTAGIATSPRRATRPRG
jgi:hypothetical protein